MRYLDLPNGRLRVDGDGGVPAPPPGRGAAQRGQCGCRQAGQATRPLEHGKNQTPFQTKPKSPEFRFLLGTSSLGWREPIQTAPHGGAHGTRDLALTLPSSLCGGFNAQTGSDSRGPPSPPKVGTLSGGPHTVLFTHIIFLLVLPINPGTH